MKKVAILLLAVIMVAGGVLLAMYAQADDAPGAILIGGVTAVGALGLGIRAVLDGKSA